MFESLVDGDGKDHGVLAHSRAKRPAYHQWLAKLIPGVEKVSKVSVSEGPDER